MKSINAKKLKRERTHTRIRTKVFGTAEKPRLCVFKSNTTLYVQLIDDTKSNTIASANTKEVKTGLMLEKAKETGKNIAKKAIENKIKKIVFDRGGFVYTGRVKALADGAREGGLEF